MPQEVLEQLCDDLFEYKDTKGWDYGEFSSFLESNEDFGELKDRVRDYYATRDIQVVVTGELTGESSADGELPEYFIRIQFV